LASARAITHSHVCTKRTHVRTALCTRAQAAPRPHAAVPQEETARPLDDVGRREGDLVVGGSGCGGGDATVGAVGTDVAAGAGAGAGARAGSDELKDVHGNGGAGAGAGVLSDGGSPCPDVDVKPNAAAPISVTGHANAAAPVSVVDHSRDVDGGQGERGSSVDVMPQETSATVDVGNALDGDGERDAAAEDTAVKEGENADPRGDTRVAGPTHDDHAVVDAGLNVLAAGAVQQATTDTTATQQTTNSTTVSDAVSEDTAVAPVVSPRAVSPSEPAASPRAVSPPAPTAAVAVTIAPTATDADAAYAAAAAAAADAAAVERLLPGGRIPEIAMRWIQRSHRRRRSSADVSQHREAVDWVLEALCFSHASAELKHAARKLLAVRYFTANLDADGAWCFTDVLRPGLGSRLVELGEVLHEDYDSRGLAVLLTDDVVEAAVGNPAQHPLALSHAHGQRSTQIDVLPCAEPIDLHRPEEFPEEACVTHCSPMCFIAVAQGSVCELISCWVPVCVCSCSGIGV
jgi:hypothetical protein